MGLSLMFTVVYLERINTKAEKTRTEKTNSDIELTTASRYL